MIKKVKEREDAIRLRREGKTYSEILSVVPVAKSTLALWLHSVKLAKSQKQTLTEKKLLAGKRGGLSRRIQRLEATDIIQQKAKKEVKKLSKRELWLLGVALYWAEGTKEKSYRPGICVEFTNSDPKMIVVFVHWLQESCKVSRKDMDFEIYIHKNKANEISEVRKFWSKITGFSVDSFQKVYWKMHKIKTIRKNTGDLYYGSLRVTVKASSTLNRKISAWTSGICEQYWGIV